jgi:hypothetical protein
MKRTVLAPVALAFVTLIGCGSSSGGNGSSSTPTISKLSIASPITPGVAADGQLQLSDPAGLSGLTLTFAVTGPTGLMTTFSSAITVEGDPTAETEAPLDFMFELGATTPAGTYKVSVTVADDGATSNALETSVVVK